MTPNAKAVRDFAKYTQAFFENTVYSDDCKSWYKGNGGTGQSISDLWPGSVLHSVETLRAPRWEDFEFDNIDDNCLRWLGNGWSSVLLPGGNSSFYLDPDVLDVPPEATPEADPKHKNRPFCPQSNT
jgi:hypothetical protein